MRLGKKSKVSGNKWKWTHNNPKLMGQSEGSPEKEVHSDTGLPKNNINISNKQPNSTSTRKNSPWVEGRKYPRSEQN